MKVAKKLSSSESVGPKSMNDVDRAKLNGLSINEAIERGLITDLGDDNGQFIFKHADYEKNEAAYAIVNGIAVRVSAGVEAAVDTLKEIIGDLRFTGGIST